MYFSRNAVSKLFTRHSSCRSFPPPIEPIVTVLDSFTTVGTNIALLLKQNPFVKELRLFDEDHSTCVLEKDLSQIDTSTRVKWFGCKSLRDAIKGAHLVISTGGCQSKPGQSQEELFVRNLDNVRNAALFLAEFNPWAVFCIAKPPVEALVPMAAEEYKKSDRYDPRKIIGVTTPVSMIANTLIAKHLRVDPSLVLCPIIGGMSPMCAVPVVSQTKPNVEYNSKLYSKLQETLANAEEDLLKKDAKFCFSKAAAVSRFANLVLKGLKGDPNCVECAYVAQTGHIQDFLPFMTSIVKLGPEGVSSTHMPKINDFEISRLKAAVPHILKNILLGQTYLYGNFNLPAKYKPKKSICNGLMKQKIHECNMRSGVDYSA